MTKTTKENSESYNCPKCNHEHTNASDFDGEAYEVPCANPECDFSFILTVDSYTAYDTTVECAVHTFGKWRQLHSAEQGDPQYRVRVCELCHESEVKAGRTKTPKTKKKGKA